MRNPWRFSFDRATGALWIADVGEATREEVDKARPDRHGKQAGRGFDFGWADCAGGLELGDDEGDADLACSSGRLPIYEFGQRRPDLRRAGHGPDWRNRLAGRRP